jgi:p-aminobenzoyl-glutamate transporter AbgT
MVGDANKQDNVGELAKLVDMDENVIRASGLSAEKIDLLFNQASSGNKYHTRLCLPGAVVAVAGFVASFVVAPPLAPLMFAGFGAGAVAEIVGAAKDKRSNVREEITKAANDRLVELSKQPPAPTQP